MHFPLAPTNSEINCALCPTLAPTSTAQSPGFKATLKALDIVIGPQSAISICNPGNRRRSRPEIEALKHPGLPGLDPEPRFGDRTNPGLETEDRPEGERRFGRELKLLVWCFRNGYCREC